MLVFKTLKNNALTFKNGTPKFHTNFFFTDSMINNL